MITITKLWDNIKRDVKYDKYQVSLVAYRNRNSGIFDSMDALYIRTDSGLIRTMLTNDISWERDYVELNILVLAWDDSENCLVTALTLEDA